ncbi:MAG: type II toxin-antitoxin system RelE/ParE family toxin [Oscillospiraceae bacterium]|nr:type II toxin-antitoxin system RelE/ParE family toxin [Oscillospiraceae bacterium]
MNNLYLSYEAQNDLAEIKDYITKELENPNTALAIVKKITKNMRILEDFAYAGASLSSIADIDSDYRFLVSGNYIVFYRVCGNNIYVDRVLYGRRDYMRILFGNTQTQETYE